MIPLKVTMSGWMRYREEQTADFSGTRLLSICGENGAGKSSIFDAITFALFGRHRLDGQHVSELISDGGDQCAVEFEFEQEGRRYRVRRTRGHRASQGSQGLWAWDDGVNDWVAIPNTQYARGLEQALAKLIRITPAAFTSSFLLQQGAATQFLESKPAERFSVVSSLVNLEAYQALEKKAREAQRREADEVQRLSAKLADFEGVDAESLALLRTRLERAVDQREAAVKGRERAVSLREAAREYARLTREIDATKRQIETAAELIAEAPQIEADAQRYVALDGEIATVQQVREELAGAVAAETASTTARSHLTAIDVDTLAAAAEEAVRRSAEARTAVERLTGEHPAAIREERRAADLLAIAERIGTLRGRITEAGVQLDAATRELDQLPALEQDAEHARAIVTALPLLQQFGQARKAVEKLSHEGDPRTALAGVVERSESRRRERDAVVEAAEVAVAGAATAQRQAAQVRAEWITVAEQVTQRREAAGEAVCSRCGQPIDAEQARQELDALGEQTEAAEERARVAAESAAAAETAAAAAAKRRDEHLREMHQLAVEQQKLEQDVKALEVAEEAARQSYQQFVEAAPGPLRTAVPESLPLPRLHEVYREQQAVAGREREIQTTLNRLHTLQGTTRSLAEQVGQLRADLLDAERSAGERFESVERARAAHTETDQRLRESEAALVQARSAEREARTAETEAQRALAAARDDRRDLEQTATKQDETAKGHRRTAQRLAARLEAGLAEHALTDPRLALDLLGRERERLAQAPARLAQLAEARRSESHFGGMLQKLNEDLDRIPPERRVQEGEAEVALQTAEEALRDSETVRENCQREVARMERDLEEVEAMRTALGRAESRSQRLKKLVDLLGKSGLQGALVSEALDTVMSHANAFLERLTGGSLVLRLEPGDGDALELKALDATCMREPRSVGVLSGSQKFRCAVAVASGIGQYAGAGGMRSIVIDEGFGSLDTDGQQLIIEELKNLAEHMDRVIVVSHLQAFTERAHFPDQIRVARDGDGSRIERVA
ncbi:MAG: AAA family ATPase [Dehalococcoidia bacterium]